MHPLTFYQILSLKNDARNPPSDQAIKQAYRVALLNHHPDKAERSSAESQVRAFAPEEATRLKPSVDEITMAYKTLISPTLRKVYDKELLLEREAQADNSMRLERFRAGLEIRDLDDFIYDEQNSIWSLACRCGSKRAYVVTEQELEAAQEGGEIAVGCQGCSLWVRVMFGVVADDEDTGSNAP